VQPQGLSDIIKIAKKVKARERVLSDGELKAFWLASAKER
jgi:hypothetical protein